MSLTWRTPALLLAGVVLVVLRPAGSTVWVWLALVVLLVGVDLVLAPSPRRLELRRLATPATRQGEATTTDLEVTNPGRRRVRGVLRDAWVPSAGAVGERHRLDVPAGGSRLLTTTLLPTRRGDRPTDRVTLRLPGPLGLAARQASLTAPGSLRVLPAFPSRRLLPSRLERLRELDGRSLVLTRGQGTEFDSLREYVRGDDVRSIDWRASARSRDVVVRTWRPERDRRVVVVVDTGRTSAGRVASGTAPATEGSEDAVPRLDAALDAALLLATLASRAGDRVDLVAGDRTVRAQVAGGAGREVLPRVQDALARVEPALVETSWNRLAAAVTALGRHRALVVLLTPLEPSAIEEGLLPTLATLTTRHRVVLASVRDPALERLARQRDDVRDVYQAAAAEQALARRAATADLLGALGVDVLDLDTDRLAAGLADHYLALKAAGRL
ncbi:DUF58 domain-containing protein [Nocardioides mangrovicus]|uniref:DUF58 domain-containing protein n=1 Tax=Nocardioides mangrovicus TaxID=2478913 RepID=A0A3L8P7A9_9ACTN|nr:DUF58 domain-containing protein [Nocardioides mangrovicus]RLV50623.1 DUF58 domain-containing protein [Nocardioides mangrovicus]